MGAARIILHADLDAFYASVEQRDDPALRGRPVIVAGAPPRGVVAAASYEVRKFGVRSAMPTVQALARCPHAVVVRPRMGHYARVSEAFFAILGSFTPLVEGLSLDEAFLDVTGSQALFGDGRSIAAAIKARVRAELQLVVSVGVAPTKFVAKIASDLGKPDGLFVVEEHEVIPVLHALPITRLWGVGEVTEQALAQLSLRTIGDLAAAGESVIAPRLGVERARHLVALAHGEDPRSVEPERAAVSVGSEGTFDEDLRDPVALRAPLLDHVDVACARLRRMGLRARTVTLKVKYADHRLVTRRTTLAEAAADERALGEAALSLIAAVPEIARRGVRLVGISLSGLEEPARQLALDGAGAQRGEELGRTLDRIRARFGGGTIQRAVHLDDE